MPKDALKFAVGIILTIALFSIIIVVSNKGINASKNASNQFDNILSECGDEWTIYDNATNTGSQVVKIIKALTAQSGAEIIVKTNANATGTTYHYDSTANAPVKSGAANLGNLEAIGEVDYVNPQASFHSVVTRDTNGNVIVTFTQR